MTVISAARLMRRLGSELQGLGMRALLGDADTYGSAASTSQTQNDEWLRQLASERLELIEARRKAARQHRQVSSIDARLREITNELLRGH